MEANKNLMEEINNKLSWIIQHEHKHLLNENDSLLHLIDDDILNFLVNHWYTCRERQLFFNENGVEIDEHLNVEEYTF
jgi:hypothetical protein